MYFKIEISSRLHPRHRFDLHDGGDRLRQVQRHRQGLQRSQDHHGQGPRHSRKSARNLFTFDSRNLAVGLRRED